VKAYVDGESKSDKPLMFRDGFTDLRGKFTYAKASGTQQEAASRYAQRFSIFISHDKYGSTVREVAAPENAA